MIRRPTLDQSRSRSSLPQECQPIDANHLNAPEPGCRRIRFTFIPSHSLIKAAHVPSSPTGPNANDIGNDAHAEFAEILQATAHAFEGSFAKNRQRLRAFVGYFPKDLGTILDVGSGVGAMIEMLTVAGANAVGIDQDSRQAAIAQANGLPVTQALAHEYLAHTQQRYGGIFLRHVIEHFDGPDGLELLYLCRRALNPGGIIAIITPNFETAAVRHTIFWLDVTHRRPYPLPLLLHIFAVLGLETIDSGYREDEEERDTFIVGRAPMLPAAPL